MKRFMLWVLTTLFLFSITPSVSGHTATTFKACTVHVKGLCIATGASFYDGDTVIVKGEVKPAPAGVTAHVMRREPYSDAWRKVAEVRVAELGRMRFVWKTHHKDAVQSAPYLFRFEIPGHGASNETEAYVLLGE